MQIVTSIFDVPSITFHLCRTMANAKGGAMDKLNEDLQDVTRIMTKNMEDLLWRGDSLDRKSSFA